MKEQPETISEWAALLLTNKHCETITPKPAPAHEETNMTPADLKLTRTSPPMMPTIRQTPKMKQMIIYDGSLV